MAEETHDLKIDRDSGVVSIDGNEYLAHELTYDHEHVDKVQVLTIRAENGDVYRFETAKRTLFGGFGAVGDVIGSFLVDFPHLKAAAMEEIRRRELAAEEARASEARTKQIRDLLAGNILRIETPDGLLLKKDEYAVRSDINVRFCQEKTKTTYYGGSVRVKVTKGISVGGGRGSPVREEFIATLDTGRLTLTSKRLIFSGERKSSTVYLSKIAAVERDDESIALTKENAVKKIIFADIDSELYAGLIERLVQEE